MKLDRRGVTLVEIIVSIALISAVLIFLMSLFVSVRGTYNTSRVEADYDMLVSTFIKSVGDDIDKYGLLSVEYKEGTSNSSEVVFTFNEYRPTKLSERIKKVLKIYSDAQGLYHISYAYDSDVSDNVVSAERSTNVVRAIPKDGIIEASEIIQIKRLAAKAIEVKIPLINTNGTDYTINIYGLLEAESES